MPRDAADRSALLAGPEGTVVDLTARIPAGFVHHARVIHSSAYERQAFQAAGLSPHMYQFYALIGYASFATFAACAVLLMMRRGRDPLAPWASLAILLVTITVTPMAAWWRSLPSYIAAIAPPANIGGFGLLAFVLALFPSGRFEPRRLTGRRWRLSSCWSWGRRSSETSRRTR